MTILPGSLDYLYYNGILDHIPYEAYEMSPIAARNQNNGMLGGSQQNYINPMQGQLPYTMQNSASQYGIQGNPMMMQGMGISGSTNTMDYINAAKQGNLYNYNSPDMFVGSTYSQGLTGMKNEQQPTQSIRDSITNTTRNISNKFSGMSPTGKGLIGLGTLLLTIIMFVKGGKRGKIKKSPSAKKSFLSKLNPKNWFKKEVQQEPIETPKTFWQKLGFGKNNKK